MQGTIVSNFWGHNIYFISMTSIYLQTDVLEGAVNQFDKLKELSNHPP